MVQFYTLTTALGMGVCVHVCVCVITQPKEAFVSKCLRASTKCPIVTSSAHGLMSCFCVLKIWEDCVHEGNPGQNHQQVQR
jgi:hypothetical protein